MQDVHEDYLLSRKRIFSATVIVIIVTLLSKISGLARDQVMTGYFGMSYDTDAYTWAFFIPNLFKILFAESLIIAAFIPIYSSYLKEEKKEEIGIFINSVTNIMVLFFVFISLIIFIFSPQIGVLLSGIANNLMDINKFVIMSRIMSFSVLMLSMSGLTTGILNSHNIFTMPSFAPFVLNIMTILFVVLLSHGLGIISIAIGTMAGSVMQLVIQIPQLKVSKVKYSFKIDFKNKAVREILSLMFPILLSLGAVQINVGVDKFFALGLGGGNTTALDIAWRVTNLPFGIFSVAVITVLYPLISRQAAAEDIKGIKESFSLGVREMGYIMLPAITGLIILSHPIIKLLFERNNFTSADTVKVATIIIFQSIGLIFFGLLIILNRIFYAFKNVKTPLKVALVSILINALLDWLFIKFLNVAGLALSTSLVAAFNMLALIFILRKKVGFLGGKRIAKSFGKMLLSSAIMGAAIYFVWSLLEKYAYINLWYHTIILLLIIIMGVGLYILSTYIFKMEEIKFVVNMFKKLKVTKKIESVPDD
ncbi:MAG: murein biosynthesis integral membrane protein MurJ [Actinobacteria bacterium]|nr:murein biosynthesis integral membrane protein MurJ [Actinomycetota bacterium]MCL5073436.1 murein biosynthesis integral membrane protein MurJ [Actinomycetota bacterium]